MPTTNPKLSLSGENIRFQMYVGGKPVADFQTLIREGSVEEKAVLFEDKYLGRTRDRLDKKLTGYKYRFTLDLADMSIPDQFTSIETLREANSAVPEMSFGFISANRDASFSAFSLQKCVGTWKAGMKGKDDRIPLEIEGMAEDKVKISL